MIRRHESRNIMSPSEGKIFLGWTKLHVSFPAGHQMYIVASLLFRCPCYTEMLCLYVTILSDYLQQDVIDNFIKINSIKAHCTCYTCIYLMMIIVASEATCQVHSDHNMVKLNRIPPCQIHQYMA
jgi:hypothetical protein